MAQQQFVQLAHTFNPSKHSIPGAYISEKLDGERAIWDGGISRDLLASQVPYANTVKDYRLKEPPIATGLWSRTGKVIHAPDWFLDQLPAFPLDGELWMGRKNWQQLSSTVSQKNPDDRWHMVEYKIIDSPSWEALFKGRIIKVRNEYEYEVQPTALAFAASRSRAPGVPPHWTFEFIQRWLGKTFSCEGQVSLVPQIELPYGFEKAMEIIDSYSKRVLNEGGEGIVIRQRTALWVPERTWGLLKHKPWFDAEGTVTGYFAGKETDKGSKLLGMMGALEVEWQGAVFKISGFTDFERKLPSSAEEWAAKNPGSRLPAEFENRSFPIGATVTFKYRELSDDGVPKEARYHRKAES